ncbi:hypothetical protein RB195_012962 [Necator americanus]|uniref:Uncharacterized protein n=1 Tax=Necator americanus TaxID=51031 RepID=A0ABR1DTL9_NECAM
MMAELTTVSASCFLLVASHPSHTSPPEAQPASLGFAYDAPSLSNIPVDLANIGVVDTDCSTEDARHRHFLFAADLARLEFVWRASPFPCQFANPLLQVSFLDENARYLFIE